MKVWGVSANGMLVGCATTKHISINSLPRFSPFQVTRLVGTLSHD